MKKLIAVLCVLFVLGAAAGCAMKPGEAVPAAGETYLIPGEDGRLVPGTYREDLTGDGTPEIFTIEIGEDKTLTLTVKGEDKDYVCAPPARLTEGEEITLSDGMIIFDAVPGEGMTGRRVRIAFIGNDFEIAETVSSIMG